MEKIIVKGGNELNGDVRISAAKNSVLPIIAASILSDTKVTINNSPMLEDVYVICDVIKNLGSDIYINKESNVISIDNSSINCISANNELVRRMRASFLIMGPMLAKYGCFKLSQPGGCNIGSRPIDLHLKGLKAMGAEINFQHGFIEADCKKLNGASIYLDFPSVGATENILMAATMAKGTTIIENAAEEPEVKDLADFLISMGAKIQGAGSGKILIEGVKELKGSSYTPIFDRIEAGTFMVAAAITGSTININGANEENLRPVIEKLKESGVKIEDNKEKKNILKVIGTKDLIGTDIKTLPYPGFPTDMQAQMMSLLAVSEGTSIITETVFENRFMHAAELMRMGAKIKIEGRSAFVEGVDHLTGCHVKATDLRAGAALILAGLVAKGQTEIYDIYHIDRGYTNIEEKFKKLGADIKRVNI